MTIRLRILLLGAAAVGSLLFLLVSGYLVQIGTYQQHRAVAADIAAVRTLLDLIHELQKERGQTAGVLAVRSPENERLVVDSRRHTDRLVAGLSGPAAVALKQTVGTLREQVAQGRIDGATAHAGYSRAIELNLDSLARLAQTATAPGVKDHLAALVDLAFAKEYLGQIRAELNKALNRGRVDAATRQAVARLDALYRGHVRQFRRDAPAEAVSAFDLAVADDGVTRTMAVVAAALDTEARPIDLSASDWFAAATATMDRIKAVEDATAAAVSDRQAALVAEVRRDLTLQTAGTVALALMILGLSVSAIRGMLRALDKLLSSVERIIETKDFSTRIPLRSVDEIDTISRGFNELLDIADRLLREKDFLASTDMLTGVPNRLRFSQGLATELARRQRHPGPASLVLFDIDRFKQINDGFGHDAGDEVLKALGRLVAGMVRQTDLFARWGGEEFVILVPDDRPEAAAALAEKLRRAIERQDFRPVGRVTASFGIAGWTPGDTAETWCKRADEALYRAKHDGRNRVVVACEQATDSPAT